MPSQDFKRSDRIADLIKVEISKVLSMEVKDPRVQGITVLNVLLTPDMKKADIFISNSNSFNEIDSEEVKIGLEKAKGFIRRKLSRNLNLRRTPEIFFKIEDIF
ncbi:30S ribosome-binding factor RbfA [Gammaproteobacteria bacterium]|nr:30S ribosome-binding factor RbfA [SAR86 cluster bacterium]MDB3880883.1 30S ribosome-binding factor RbfA [Gammaproteobacteria bacterium]MDB3975894.1 30S ribosome-binding factor RbfA [Gammaproteobacteria bacterium]MDC0577931.1 30S ribosome-binding factor RbfA [Gammaproteobacteria bacterium]|tara:strand:+ start:334 stop:645 length:312 start_codon:yes stop_codon:yes gene_type:complete